MDTTNLSSASSQHLPLVWVIEALSESEQVDMAVLDGLSNSVPELPNQSWGRNTRERLALRRLEDLLRGLRPNADAVNVASTSNPHSRFAISVSEPVEDVLLRVRDQIAAANLTMSEIEILKSSVSQFVLQKRASLPKCALQQLKEKVVEGDQMSTILLWENSGLDREHQEDERVVMGSGPDGAAELIDRSTNNVTVQTLEVNSKVLAPEKVSKECFGKTHFGAVSNVARSSGQRTENGESHSMDEVSASREHVREDVQKDPLKSILPSGERERSVCKDQQESNICMASNEVHEVAEQFTKNGKFNSMKDDSGSLLVNDPIFSPCRRHLLSAVSEVNESLKGADVQDLQQTRISVLNGDNDGDTQAHNSRTDDNKGEDVPLDGLRPNYYIDGVDDHCTKPEEQSSKVDNADKPPSSVSNEDIAIVAEKDSFLSSEKMLNPGSQRTDWTEQSSCIKCNRGSQLLICCVSSCPIAVHESCVGSAGCFDETGNFYCPFCSLAKATATYREAKKKAALVKEKAALARDHLFKFMCMVRADQQGQSSQKTLMEEPNQSKVVEDMNAVNEFRDIRQQKNINSNHPDPAGGHLQEVDVDRECINCSAFSEGPSVSPFSERTVVSPTKGKAIAVKNHQDARMLEDQEPLERSTDPSVDIAQKEEEMTVICKKTPIGSSNDEGGKTKLDKRKQSPIKGKESDQAVPAGTVASSHCIGTETAFTNQEHACVETEKLDLPQQNVEPAQGPSSPPNVDSEEISTSENDDCISYEFRRRRKPLNHYSNQASPHSRRKKIPWTAEEEEKLKEGVRRFAATDGRSIPWKKILLFGQPTFQESRTTIDLKDKWRNVTTREGRRAFS